MIVAEKLVPVFVGVAAAQVLCQHRATHDL
jgi:hypothetical protein